MRGLSLAVLACSMIALSGCSGQKAKSSGQSAEPAAAESAPSATTAGGQATLVTERMIAAPREEVWNSLLGRVHSGRVATIYGSPDASAMVVQYDGPPADYVACTDDSNNPQIDPTYRLIARSV